MFTVFRESEDERSVRRKENAEILILFFTNEFIAQPSASLPNCSHIKSRIKKNGSLPHVLYSICWKKSIVFAKSFHIEIYNLNI